MAAASPCPGRHLGIYLTALEGLLRGQSARHVEKARDELAQCTECAATYERLTGRSSRPPPPGDPFDPLDDATTQRLKTRP